MKTCLGCRIEKPLNDFHLHSLGKFGRNPRCKVCRSQKQLSSLVALERSTGLRTCKQCGVVASMNTFPRTLPSGYRRICNICFAKASSVRRAVWAKTDHGRVLIKATRNRHQQTQRYRDTTAAYRSSANEAARRYRQSEHGREMVAKNHALRRGAKVGECVSRLDVWHRDGGQCKLCEKPVLFKDMHLDHVIPIAVGGAHTIANTQTSHRFCNQSKGSRRISVCPA